jgi:SlyX protein
MDEDLDPIERRLTALEIKASYGEDLLDRLNEIVVRQQAQIDRLLREAALWRQQADAEDTPSVRSLRDELPPHY